MGQEREKELEAIPASKSAIAAVRCARAALLLSSLRSSPRSLRTVSPDAPPRDTEDLLRREKLRRSVADLRTRSDLFGWVEEVAEGETIDLHHQSQSMAVIIDR
ncbi:hypothetical protein OPV22_023790 [Ensete ventricosum]|uniref:Uncharacterized protein n=1 Tax=Ensete ventricosum TaxID=4639 RepID=A0AAV8QRF7_ENSVE|nr:hypothetical protein OPV22_023790 [Ensete ventricosum]